MKIGDLIRNKRHPHAGIGIVVDVGAPAHEPRLRHCRVAGRRRVHCVRRRDRGSQ